MGGNPNRGSIRKMEDISNTIDQMNLTDIYGICHPTAERYIFFSSAHETFPCQVTK